MLSKLFHVEQEAPPLFPEREVDKWVHPCYGIVDAQKSRCCSCERCDDDALEAHGGEGRPPRGHREDAARAALLLPGLY